VSRRSSTGPYREQLREIGEAFRANVVAINEEGAKLGLKGFEIKEPDV